MGRTIGQKIARLPAKRRAKVNARAAELIAEEMSLQDLRKALNRMQVEVARTLKVEQDTVSRYEQRTDMLLSTLQDYVEAMGGELDLVARFPNRLPVRIKGLRDISGDASARKLFGRSAISVVEPHEFQVEDPLYYTQAWCAQMSLNARKEKGLRIRMPRRRLLHGRHPPRS